MNQTKHFVMTALISMVAVTVPRASLAYDREQVVGFCLKLFDVKKDSLRHDTCVMLESFDGSAIDKMRSTTTAEGRKLLDVCSARYPTSYSEQISCINRHLDSLSTQ